MSEEMVDKYSELLSLIFKPIVKQALRELKEEGQLLLDTDEDARKLAEINAKVNITVPEAAYLLRCSEPNIYKLIKEAEKGKSKHPIPFLDKERLGIYVLPREELLKWAAPKKLRAA